MLEDACSAAFATSFMAAAASAAPRFTSDASIFIANTAIPHHLTKLPQPYHVPSDVLQEVVGRFFEYTVGRGERGKGLSECF